MTENNSGQITYNGFETEKWNECQSYLFRQNHGSSGSSFLDVNGLRRSGRKLEDDFKASGLELEPGKFADIREIRF